MGSMAIFVLPTGAVHSLLFAIHIHTAYWSQNISSRLSTMLLQNFFPTDSTQQILMTLITAEAQGKVHLL